ncbi:sensor domain-containing diguanylate cyclase [Melaminivora sp.]|uniref:GGDEF domain-containing protein n=1 Tax=Melaminivora sp. TaxID=1933032 RepID=UPI0028A97205|nr:diguanylate cyclase [Melaminivora sp.]
MEASFVWDDNFVTHLPAVDEQHQALVELFNELSRALFNPPEDSDALLADIYGRLLAYTEYHFRDEEEMMAEVGLDERHVELHRHLHHQFVDQIRVLWTQRHNMSDPSTTLAGFLTSWLGLHILGIDQSMARQVASVREGMTAQEAFERERETRDNGTQALLKMIGKLYSVLTSQNAQLALVNQELEERVAQRTRELQEANARLRAFSRTDALLGIANRAYFEERLEQACALARRGQRPLALIMIDVDYFKRYNDHYGHVQGDACLQAVARAVAGCVRRGTDLVARYGGEELVAILHDTDEGGALQVARRMVQAVRDLALPHAGTLVPGGQVSVSAGVCAGVPQAEEGRPGGAGAAALVACADTALYRAKEQGRDRCLAYGQPA